MWATDAASGAEVSATRPAHARRSGARTQAVPVTNTKRVTKLARTRVSVVARTPPRLKSSSQLATGQCCSLGDVTTPASQIYSATRLFLGVPTRDGGAYALLPHVLNVLRLLACCPKLCRARLLHPCVHSQPTSVPSPPCLLASYGLPVLRWLRLAAPPAPPRVRAWRSPRQWLLVHWPMLPLPGAPPAQRSLRPQLLQLPCCRR